MARQLAELHAQLTTADFLLRDWTRNAVAFEGALSCESASELLSIDQFDDLLCCTRHSEQAEILVFKDQQPSHDYATPHAAFADGCSLIINHADKVWPRLNQLCIGLAAVFRHCYANVYLTPHSSQTAPLHADDRDVLIIQTHGSKDWDVWRPPHWAQTLPFADEQLGKDGLHVSEAELGAKMLRRTLCVGDVLYIPRGAPHAAIAAPLASSCSLHVTIAIPTADLNWHGYISQANAHPPRAVATWHFIRRKGRWRGR
eukprot:120408-Pleurochrysis_carterae.AAC.2